MGPRPRGAARGQPEPGHGAHLRLRADRSLQEPRRLRQLRRVLCGPALHHRRTGPPGRPRRRQCRGHRIGPLRRHRRIDVDVPKGAGREKRRPADRRCGTLRGRLLPARIPGPRLRRLRHGPQAHRWCAARGRSHGLLPVRGRPGGRDRRQLQLCVHPAHEGHRPRGPCRRRIPADHRGPGCPRGGAQRSHCRLDRLDAAGRRAHGAGHRRRPRRTGLRRPLDRQGRALPGPRHDPDPRGHHRGRTGTDPLPRRGPQAPGPRGPRELDRPGTRRTHRRGAQRAWLA